MKLLKSYFNFFINPKLLKKKTKPLANRSRKLSTNKVFIGKGQIKHTNEKVLITTYIYNAEQLYLKSLIRKKVKLAYYPDQLLTLELKLNEKNKRVLMYNRPLTLREFLNVKNNPSFIDHPDLHLAICFRLF